MKYMKNINMLKKMKMIYFIFKIFLNKFDKTPSPLIRSKETNCDFNFLQTEHVD